MPSSHLILCHPLLLLPPIPPSIRVFSNESTLRTRWPKYWSFSFSIIPSKEHPGLKTAQCVSINLFMKVKVKLLSCVRLSATPRTVAYQAPPSMGFSRQEYCSGLPFHSPGDLPDPGMELRPPALRLRADALPCEPPGKSKSHSL